MRDMGIIVSVFGQLIYISFHFIRVCGGSRISQTEGGRAQSQSWDTNELFRPMFPKNCKEMKEIGPGGANPESVNACIHFSQHGHVPNRRICALCNKA